jgi:hypothetical protein
MSGPLSARLITHHSLLITYALVPAGFEPAIFPMSRGCPNPLNDGTNSTPTRIRTRNSKLEAWDDSPFHHRGIYFPTLTLALTPTLHCPFAACRSKGARAGVRQITIQRKARESNPHLRFWRTALAERPGQPYPATFRRKTRK